MGYRCNNASTLPIGQAASLDKTNSVLEPKQQIPVHHLSVFLCRPCDKDYMLERPAPRSNKDNFTSLSPAPECRTLWMLFPWQHHHMAQSVDKARFIHLNKLPNT